MNTDPKVPRSADLRARLPDPLSSVLRDPVTEASVARMWRGIEVRRAAPTTVRPQVIFGWASAGAAVAVVVMLLLHAVFGRAPAPSPSAAAPYVGPLLLETGAPFTSVDVPKDQRRVDVALADRSHIWVEPDASLEPLASSAHEFVVRVARGTATFDVEPKGPRVWVVEAGIASVEVVGTRFTVIRRPDFVRVEVARGVVLVRGATVPDGVVRLEAGGSIDVIGPARAAPDGGALSSRGGERRDPKPVLRADSREGWRDRARDKNYEDAYVLLGADGLEVESARARSAEDLFELADVARLSGHAGDAVRPLERLLSVYASNPRAPLAAVTLGRIELGLGSPAKASAAFERALALGVPRGLEEDVYARLVEAYVKGGNPTLARSVADAYRSRFPEGRRKTDIDRWLLR